MAFHDDTPLESVAKQAATAIREAARMIGKADRNLHDADIQELQLAMIELGNVLDLKSRINAGRG